MTQLRLLPRFIYVLVFVGVLSNALEWHNWDHRQQCFPELIASPTSESEIRQIVQHSSFVRVAGAGHSFSPIVLTNHTLINLSNYDQVVDFENDTITVQAGMPLYKINEYLESQGRALPNLGAVSVQTAAGATQTGTHGTGNTQSLSGNIRKLQIILANGTVVDANEVENVDLFNAARVGLGSFGVLSTVTFQHFPIWTMEQITMELPWEVFLKELPLLKQIFERLQWYYTGFPHSGNVTVLLRVNTTEPVKSGCWNNTFSSKPTTTLPTRWTAWPSKTKSCIDVCYKTLCRIGLNNTNYFTEMEMNIDASEDMNALIDMISFQRRVQNTNTSIANIFTGVRYVNADAIWLSPFYKRRTAVFSMIIYASKDGSPRNNEINTFHQGMENVLLKNYHARPHPGKANYFTFEMMQQVYPKLSDFITLQNEVDPKGKFLNQYLWKLFSKNPVVIENNSKHFGKRGYLAVMIVALVIGLGVYYHKVYTARRGYQSV